MTTALLTDVEVAGLLKLESVERLHELRRRNHWECVKLSRFEVRFTVDQVAAIVAQQTERKTSTGDKPAPAALTSVSSLIDGQTARSAARSRSPKRTVVP